MNRLPPGVSLHGIDALREAAAGSYEQLMELVGAALRRLFEMQGDGDPWPNVQALFADSVVVRRGGRLWRHSYSIGADKAVALGEPQEVEETFEPAGTTRVGGGAFLEAAGDAARYRIRVIRAGVSGNGNLYPDAVLREAVPLFEGVRVFVKGDDEHLAGKGKDVRNLIGRLVEAAFVPGPTPDSGEVQAILELIEPQGAVAVKLREAWDRGMTGLFGFSIDAVGPAKAVTRQGRRVRAASAIAKVHSVDLIVEPGAGGEVINLIEARRKESTIMDRDELVALIEARRPELLKGKDPAALTDEELKAIFAEALAAPAAPPAPPAPAVTAEDLRMIEARAEMRTRIDASSLPAAAKARLVKTFGARERFTEAEVDQAIADEQAYLAQFTESGAVRGLGDDIRIESGETRAEKVAAMLDAFFDRGHKDHAQARSFKECYVLITGDRRVTGELRNCDQALLRESLQSQSLDDVLGDAITRRMIADYRNATVFDIWRQLATTVSVGDFRTQERTRWGGYGDLPIVGESQPYLGLDSPDDEKVTYAVAKRGGTEDVTLEMIKNDDAGVIMRIPIKLSRAAKRTLSKFVLDFIRTNPTIFDGVALFHADHNNLGSTALSATTLAAGRLAMKEQKEYGSDDEIGVGPKYLWVPDALEETAVDLFRRNTNNDKNFLQSLALEVMPVWYWTDTNDWALSADPMDIPTIEIGFLDGEEEPSLFVQDSPTAGSMFSHDKLTWKICHIYGGNVLDFRGLYKAVVAGG